MKKNIFEWPLSVIFGILILLMELLFILTACLLWPTETSGAYSIFTNYHSDLGNSSQGYNTAEGAAYYNAGQIIQGLAVIMFFGGLYTYFKKDQQKNVKLIIGQIFGIILGFGWLMCGIYSEEFLYEHLFWASVYFLGSIPAIILISIEIIKHPDYEKSIGYFGFLIILIDIIWIVLALVLLYVEPAPPFFLAMEFIIIWGIDIWFFLIALNIFKNEIWQEK